MDIAGEFNFHSENISFILKRKPAVISWLSFSIKNEIQTINQSLKNGRNVTIAIKLTIE